MDLGYFRVCCMMTQSDTQKLDEKIIFWILTAGALNRPNTEIGEYIDIVYCSHG